MRHLIAAALTLFALPATAEPVELACNGTLHRRGDVPGESPMNGMHILVGENTVVVSGGNHIEPTTYSVDSEASDAASLFFSSGRWEGSLNRYSGELLLWPVRQPEVTKSAQFKGWLAATCGKADPLF